MSRKPVYTEAAKAQQEHDAIALAAYREQHRSLKPDGLVIGTREEVVDGVRQLVTVRMTPREAHMPTGNGTTVQEMASKCEGHRCPR